MESCFPLHGLTGRVFCRDDGMRAELWVEAENEQSGLYKVYIKGNDGQLLLGTLVPEAGSLKLRRSFSIEELRRAHCWPVEGGYAVLAFSFGRPSGEESPQGWMENGLEQVPIADAVLHRSAAQVRGLLVRRGRAGFWMAAPYGERSPFPITPLFCLGKPARIGQRRYILYHFDTRGYPTLPHEGDKNEEC